MELIILLSLCLLSSGFLSFIILSIVIWKAAGRINRTLEKYMFTYRSFEKEMKK